MREPTEHEIHVKSRLLYLFDLTVQNYPDWDGDQIKEYIDVGEWGLAVDSLAYFYLSGNYAATETFVSVFLDLGKRMNLLGAQHFPSITNLALQNQSRTPPPA